MYAPMHKPDMAIWERGVARLIRPKLTCVVRKDLTLLELMKDLS